MTLKDLLTIAEVQVVILYPSDSGEFYADIKNGEMKETTGDSMLSGFCGYGATPDAALLHMISNLRGKILVIDAMTEKRRHFRVPETLIYG